jgi:ubiquinone/menaquinone biosynthesis C-methylase UbiE
MSKNNDEANSVSEKPFKNPMEGMNPRMYDLVTALMMTGRQKAIRQMTIELAEIHTGNQVLEIGCGTGTLTILAKKQTGENGLVFGIDPLPQMIKRAQQKAAKSKLKIDFQIAPYEQIPFPENHFDVVLASFMIFHTNDDTRQQGLNEVFRVLKPGGKFLIIDTKPMEKKNVQKIAVELTDEVMWERPLDKLLPMLENSGFNSIKLGDTKYSIIGYVKAQK